MNTLRRTFLIGLLLTFACHLSAQKISYEDGKGYARKTGPNTYEPIPAGVVSYECDGEQVWILFDGVQKSMRGTIKQKNKEKVLYLNTEGNVVGYYVSSQGHYYIASGTGEIIEKYDNYAVLQDGILTDKNGEVWLRVEKGFDPVMVGFFIFLN